MKRPGERTLCDWCPNLIPYSPLISSLTFSFLPCPRQIPGEVRTIKKDDQPLDLNMVEILHMKYAVWAEGHMLETCVAAIACLAQTINDLIVELLRTPALSRALFLTMEPDILLGPRACSLAVFFRLAPGGARNSAQDMPKRLENCAMLRRRTDRLRSE